jgi:hypothetical protein
MKKSTIQFYKRKLLVQFYSLIYSKKIKKGNLIKCLGIGYPHWKNEVFIVTADFKDGTIGILNCIRVSEKDFRVIDQSTSGGHS